MITAVDEQDLGGHPPAEGTAKKKGRVSHLLRLGVAAQGFFFTGHLACP